MPLRILTAFLLILFVPHAAVAAPFASERITVSVQGKGDDVILIPGLSSSPRVWAEMAKALPDHRYHMIQVAGFAGTPVRGNSAGPVAAPVAAEIARYIAAAKLNKPAVIGHSMGGTIGLMLAARHPDAVSKLMVVDMIPFMGVMFGKPTPEAVRPIADAMLAQSRAETLEARAARQTQTIHGMIDTVAMRQGAVDDALQSDPDVVSRAFHELVVTDLGPELPKIIAPTTVLYVTPKGQPLTDAQMDGYYKTAYAPLNGAALERIPNSAHFIMWDAPDRFQSEVKAFLD